MKADNTRALLNDADELGHEARIEQGDHAALKVWLRMLACTTQIEDEIRRRLRERFSISLARFDYLAQLYRKPEGLMMKELSRNLMVTGGNVTGLTDELESEGLVLREPRLNDRRSWVVRLSERGRTSFQTMAAEHEQWILEIFSALDSKSIQQLTGQLGTLRLHVLGLQGQKSNSTQDTK
jgi:DNA-binding MarR family transcriptional regulator